MSFLLVNASFPIFREEIVDGIEVRKWIISEVSQDIIQKM